MSLFPSTKPTISITSSLETVRSVDCPELQWWFAVPREGEEYAFAFYDADTHALDGVCEMKAVAFERNASLDTVEFEVREKWFTERERRMFSPRMSITASLDSTRAMFLSVTQFSHDGTVMEASDQRNPNFMDDWGTTLGRLLEDNGKFQQTHDGSLQTTDRDGAGAGTYDVTIGRNTFRCLRVLDYDPTEPFGGELGEAYVDARSGRTVYYREFSGRYYRQAGIGTGNRQRGVDILEMYPNNTRIVIDGELYVHCGCTMRGHDVIPLAGLGISPS